MNTLSLVRKALNFALVTVRLICIYKISFEGVLIVLIGSAVLPWTLSNKREPVYFGLYFMIGPIYSETNDKDDPNME